jgi:hypothetical protein
LNALGWAGVGMAVAGLLLIIVELALVLPRALRLTKRLRELNLLLENDRQLTHNELQLLQQATLQTQSLLRPYRRLRRWLTHPLTLALFASYRRRAATRRSASPAR